MDVSMLEFQQAMRDVSDDEREVLVVFKNAKGKAQNHLLRGDWGKDAIAAHDAARAAFKATVDAAQADLQKANDELAEAARVAALQELAGPDNADTIADPAPVATPLTPSSTLVNPA